MASTSFFQQLTERSRAINSFLCVGLDPHANELTSNTPEAAEAFCMKIIEATSDIAAAYKPNSAFFEAFGAEGVAVLSKVIKAIPAGIPVLLDAKRGDISTTADAYATAAFQTMGAHSITINPYMGLDSVAPFTKDASRGVFVLCKTSNASSGDFQTLECRDAAGSTQLLYEQVALRASSWNEGDNVGLVVGATDSEALRRVRAAVPDMWILAPGVGAQGGDVEQAIANGISRSTGMGMLIPVSRGISRAADVREAALGFRDAFNAAREKALSAGSSAGAGAGASAAVAPAPAPADAVGALGASEEEFIDFAIQQQVLCFGEFTLKSGRQSPYFFNAGLFRTGGAMLSLARHYAAAIVKSGLEFDVIFGPAYKGISLAACTAMALAQEHGRDVPFAYNRKEVKDHGEGGSLVGASMEGQRVLIIDDVITAGTAIRESIRILAAAKGTAAGVVVALDRQEKGPGPDGLSAIQSVEKEFGLSVVTIVTLRKLLLYLEKRSEGSEDLKRIRQYSHEYGI